MLEAYKKCLLCSLLECGETPKLPKYTSPTITRPIKSHLSAYTEFAEAFAGGKVADLRASLEKHAAAFAHDKNLGLAKQCVTARLCRSIRTLTETYLTLSLSQIATNAGLADAAEAERRVREMVVSGDICATIDAQKGMVHFLERGEHYHTHETMQTMERALQGAIGLAGKLHELHSSLAIDQHYLARISTQERLQPQWDDEAMLAK
jgi:COP9 signalosome complex subunit 3